MSNLPPGVTDSMLPGNTPEDVAWGEFFVWLEEELIFRKEIERKVKTLFIILNIICLMAFLSLGSFSVRLQEKVETQQETIESLHYRIMHLEQRFLNNKATIRRMGGLK